MTNKSGRDRSLIPPSNQIAEEGALSTVSLPELLSKLNVSPLLQESLAAFGTLATLAIEVGTYDTPIVSIQAHVPSSFQGTLEYPYRSKERAVQVIYR